MEGFVWSELTEDPQIVTPLEEDLEITRLGEGLAETGRLSEHAIACNVEQLSLFTTRARELGASEIVAVGTMALREARNADEFVGMARQQSKAHGTAHSSRRDFVAQCLD